MSKFVVKPIALNVLNAYLACRGPLGSIEQHIDFAHEVGFSSIHFLPLRGYKYGRIRDWSKHVTSYQDPYMSGSLGAALLRTANIVGEPEPTLMDWALFGNRLASPVFPNAILNARYFYPNPTAFAQMALEVEPDVSQWPTSYFDFAYAGGKLSLDTRHLRRLRRDGEHGIFGWESLLDLPISSVAMTHIHPGRAEISSYIKGKKSALTDLIVELVKRFPKAQIMFETFPNIKFWQDNTKYFRDLWQVTQYWVAQATKK